MNLAQPSTGNPIFQFLGALTIQGSTASGIFRINDPQSSPPCIPANQDIPFTGSIDSNNLLTLTSASFSGSVATLKIQLPLSTIGSTVSSANGTAQVIGGPCAVASSTIGAEFVPPITGTFTGTLYSSDRSVSGPTTIILTQSPANADGQFPLSGSITFSSSGCTLSSTLTGMITGPFLKFAYSLPAPSDAIAVVGLSPGMDFSIYVASSTSSCASGFYQGAFTRQ
ncbi:hypothetical protein [Edaphobacter bradus]|uniref:hypothetical protein n=1 Tax=Edaphobacter bradus TaxID=2259016 RepID=UPI0021E0E32F|nr:hypothetical protein [Edaphobacter bradus]